MFIKSKILFIAVLGMAMSAFQPAHAQQASQACKDAGKSCGIQSTGGLLICGAAAYLRGKFVPADIACEKISEAGIDSCVKMAQLCGSQPGVQPTISTLTYAGSTSGSVQETKTCSGSNRINGLTVHVENSRVRRIKFTCTNGVGLNTGPQIGSASSSSCSSGHLAQGATVRSHRGFVTGFILSCDNAFYTTSQDANYYLGQSGSINQSRQCAEGKYLVGYRAWHGGSSSYLTGIEFLCRALPE
jgi:hypothetical protein